MRQLLFLLLALIAVISITGHLLVPVQGGASLADTLFLAIGYLRDKCQ